MAKSSETLAKNSKDRVFIYPTDTVWGIGASIFSKEGTAHIRDVKKSSEDKPLSILFDGVDEFQNYFKLPAKFDYSFLDKFFALESTMLLPISWLVKDIPSFITGSSNFIGCRCLKRPAIKKIVRIVGGPISTTSLNLSGETPIIRYKEAQLFMRSHISTATLVEDPVKNVTLSGTPSTLVEFNRNGFKIIREGRVAKEVRELVGL